MAGDKTVGEQSAIAVVGLVERDEDIGLVEEFRAQGFEGTIFPASEILVQSPTRFKGFDLGNGCLLGATIDGELDRWNLDNLEAELESADDLHEELGFGRPTSLFLPGHRHLLAHGSYRRYVQLRYPLVVSPASSGCSIHGYRRGLKPIFLSHLDMDSLEPLLSDRLAEAVCTYLLIMAGDPVLASLRQAAYRLLEQRKSFVSVGPLPDLLTPPHTYFIS